MTSLNELRNAASSVCDSVVTFVTDISPLVFVLCTFCVAGYIAIPRSRFLFSHFMILLCLCDDVLVRVRSALLFFPPIAMFASIVFGFVVSITVQCFVLGPSVVIPKLLVHYNPHYEIGLMCLTYAISLLVKARGYRGLVSAPVYVNVIFVCLWLRGISLTSYYGVALFCVAYLRLLVSTLPVGSLSSRTVVYYWLCALVEELLKTSICGFAFVLVCETRVTRNFLQYNIILLLHCVSMSFSFPTRVCLHVLWNLFVCFQAGWRETPWAASFVGPFSALYDSDDDEGYTAASRERQVATLVPVGGDTGRTLDRVSAEIVSGVVAAERLAREKKLEKQRLQAARRSARAEQRAFVASHMAELASKVKKLPPRAPGKSTNRFIIDGPVKHLHDTWFRPPFKAHPKEKPKPKASGPREFYIYHGADRPSPIDHRTYASVVASHPQSGVKQGVIIFGSAPTAKAPDSSPTPPPHMLSAEAAEFEVDYAADFYFPDLQALLNESHRRFIFGATVWTAMQAARRWEIANQAKKRPRNDMRVIGNDSFNFLAGVRWMGRVPPSVLHAFQAKARVYPEVLSYAPPIARPLMSGEYFPPTSPAVGGIAFRGGFVGLRAVRESLDEEHNVDRRTRVALALGALQSYTPVLGSVTTIYPFDLVEALQSAIADSSKITSYLEVRARARYQGATQSQVRVGSVGGVAVDIAPNGVADFLRATLSDQAESALEGLADLPWLSRLLALAVSIGDAKSWVGIVAACYLFLSENKFVTSVEKALRKLVERMVSAASGWWNAHYQGAEDELETEPAASSDPKLEVPTFERFKAAFVDLDFSAFVTSDLGAAVWRVLSCFSVTAIVASLGALHEHWDPMPVVVRIERLLKKPRTLDGASPLENLFQHFCRFLTTVFQRVREAWKARDWRILFDSSRTAAQWMKLTETLLYDETVRLSDGRPTVSEIFKKNALEGKYPAEITEPLTGAQRSEMLLALADDGVAYQTRFSDDLKLSGSVARLASKAREEGLALRNLAVAGAFRVPPYALFIPGPPGCGKTEFTNTIHRAIGKLHGFAVGEESMFRLQPNTNFPDGFHSGQWFCAAHDIDTTVAPPSASVKSHAQWVMEIVDSAALNMEAARVEDKGKQWASFQMFAYTTNFPLGRLKDVTHEPRAFWRRFRIIVELEVKKEFRVSEAVNELKRGAINGAVDLWDIKVRRYAPGLANSATPFDSRPFSEPEVFPTVSSFMRFLSGEFAKYLLDERALLAAKASSRVADHCVKCGLDPSFHAEPCPQFFFQAPLLGVILLFFIPVEQRERGLQFGAVFWDYLSAPLKLIFTSWAAGFWMFFGDYFFVMKDSMVQLREAAYWARIGARLYSQRFVLAGAGVGLAVTGAMMLAWSRSRVSPSWQALQREEVPAPVGFPRIDGWARRDATPVRPYQLLAPSTYTEAELCEVLQKRLFKLRVGPYTAWALRLNKGFFLVNKHCLLGPGVDSITADLPDQVAIELSRGTEHTSRVLTYESMYAVPGRDLAVCYVPSLVPLHDGWELITKFPPVSQWQAKLSPDSAVAVTVDAVIPLTGMTTTSHVFHPGRATGVWRTSRAGVDGDCGQPWVARFGNSFVIVGIHSIGDGCHSWAEDISRSELELGLYQLEMRRGIAGVRDVSVDFAQLAPARHPTYQVAFDPLPVKSSLAVALASDTPPSCVVFGTLRVPVLQMSVKTKVRPTRFRPDIEDQLTVRGLTEAFEAPKFKGLMIGDRWRDPFTLNLESTRNLGGENHWWVAAIEDFLGGADELAGRDCVRPLTDVMTVVGIPGTTIGGTNMATSAGPPFYQSKGACLEISPCRTKVAFHPRLEDNLRAIKVAKEAGLLYAPMTVHTLKDESVSKAKNDRRKIRVFNVFGFAMNFYLKKFFAPLVAFMRRHWRFFEGAGGMNLASQEILELVEFLSLGGTLPEQVHAGDRAWFDVGESTEEGLCVAECYGRLARLCQYTPDEEDWVRFLAQSVVYTVAIIKNDVVLFPNRMGTGFWVTLTFNCVRNSLQARYCWLRYRHWHPLVGSAGCFRLHNRLIVLGDDDILTTATAWFDQRTFRDELLRLGSDLTAADKSPDLSLFDRFENATFLKRRFAKVEGTWVCPIEEKTLWKMLAVWSPGELSEMDQHARMCSNVLAEAWMHGRETFDMFFMVVDRLVRKHAIVSTQLVVHTFDWYLAKYRTGTLSVWDPMANLEETGFDFQS